MRGISCRVLGALLTMLGLATGGTAQAELIDRGTDNNGKHLIYDTGLNVTWYQPSNPNGLNWFDAHTYAANLSVVYEGRTIDDWRLPRATDVNTHVLQYWGCWAGYTQHCLGELSHLWLELGGQITDPRLYPYVPNTNPRLPGNDNPFQTPYPEAGYAQALFWLDETEINQQGEPYCNNPPYCPNGYVFTWFNDSYSPGGLQGVLYAHQSNWKYAWPVRDGDVLLNHAPSVTLGVHSGDEGAAIALSAVASDADAGDTLAYGWSYSAGTGVDSGATCTFANGDTIATTITCTDEGPYTLSLTASDGKTSTTASNTLTVANVAPTVSFGAPADGALIAVNTTVSADVLIEDSGTNDTHTCVLNWGDGVTGYDAPCSQTSDLYGQLHAYVAAGVYTVAATVTDDDGGLGESERLVVVYDPAAGFVTGGGTIASPAGAYMLDPGLVGQARFGFVSKYRKGATLPEGDTQFVFEAGGMTFVSTSYDWLVVAGDGSSKAQFKGSGVINGGGNYGFLLYATDADRTAVLTDKDSFRIKIWDKTDGGAAVYDNGVEQAISGGNIVIHTGNTKK